MGRRNPAAIEEIISRAQSFPADDNRRWQTLAELDVLDLAQVYDAAERLMRSGDPASMTSAGQVLDGVFARVPSAASAGLRAAGRSLLAEVCHRDQDPSVLAAALHPYAILGGASCAMLLDLLRHPAAVVRASAAQLAAVHDDAPGDEAVEQALVAALANDADPGVRAAAAEGLQNLALDDPACRARVAGALAGRMDDPDPRIRVAAVIVSTAEDPRRQVALVADELSQADPAWPFVAVCGLIEIAAGDSADRDRIQRRLTDLRSEGWADHAPQSPYPDPVQRAELLDDAIAVFRRRSPKTWIGRRVGSRRPIR